MILYRLTRNMWSLPSIVLNGIGASHLGRRWNPMGVRAAYCATEIETCVAEIATYEILTKLDIIAHRKRSGQSVTNSLVEDVVDQEFVLTEIDTDDLSIVDVSENSTLTSALAKYGIKGNYTILNGRQSPYALLPDFWTQKLGEHIHQEGHHGMSALSARSDAGKAVILFSKNILPDKVKVLSQKKIKISAIDKAGKRITTRSVPDRSRVLLDTGEQTQIIDVLSFKI